MAEPPAILFVDDDATNRQALGLLFRGAGYAVLEAGSGLEALDLAADREPDVVVLDVNLPDISGFDVCRRLRELPATRYAGVIHLSGVHVDTQDRSQGLEGGADAYLVKPVEPRELVAHVRALLRVRAAEEAFRRAAQEWRTTFDAISDAVCLLDDQGRIRRCNRALGELVASDFDALIGRPLDGVLCRGLGLPALPPLLRDAQKERQDVQLGQRWFRVTEDPILDAKGAPAGAVLTLRDITQRVQLEEQLRQSSRLEAVGRLAGGVAHDFNNLLTAILGNVSLLIRALPPGQQEHELAGTIERAAWRAAELTRQLLGFSRQTLLWLETIEPGLLLTQAAEVARAEARAAPGGAPVEVEVSCPDGLWPVQADPGQMGQVLQVLCKNAREAMPTGGRLRLSAENTRLEAEEARGHAEARAGAFVRLRVEDSGQGIAPEVLDKIFDPFFTTKPTGQGTGLGLAMVHGIVKQHQGWIECRSEVGRGTRFDLYLPRWVGAVAPSSRLPDEPEALRGPTVSRVATPAGPRRVLLADDNALLRDLAAGYLRQGGFQVLQARDGREAVEVYTREQSAIDLVILDWIMPEVTGRDALERMRRLNPELRVLVAIGGDRPPAGATGEVDGILSKPYRERELLEAVHAALGGA
jgi:PAS domain S-box-containing protein